MFPSLGEGLIRLGEAVVTPWVMLKACAAPAALKLVLPERWEIQPGGWFMASGQGPAMPRRTLADGYRMQLIEEGGVTVARVLAPDRAQAAIGRVVIVDGAAIYDRIAVDPSHRRRGLASAVMAGLEREARGAGARRGLLVATDEGRARMRRRAGGCCRPTPLG